MICSIMTCLLPLLTASVARLLLELMTGAGELVMILLILHVIVRERMEMLCVRGNIFTVERVDVMVLVVAKCSKV